MPNRGGPKVWLFVALVADLVGLAVSVYFLARPFTDQPLTHAIFSVAAVAAVFSTAALVLLWKLVDSRLVKAQDALALAMRAIAHGDSKYAVDAERFEDLGPLPQAVNDLGRKLEEARRQSVDAVATATARAEEQKSRLAAILNDLREGVVVCNLKHQVVLYNQVALDLLQVGGEVGLGRDLFGMVRKEPVLHIFALLKRRAEGGQRSAPFVTGTTDGRILLQGRMSGIGAGGRITGYVLTFADLSAQINALGQRDALLRNAVEGLREPLERLKAQSDGRDGVTREAGLIAACLEQLEKGWQAAVTGWWPMSDLHTGDLFDLAIRQLEDAGVTANLTGLPVWVHGDSHTLVLALEALACRVHAEAGAASVDLSAAVEGERAWLDIAWAGDTVADAMLESWLSHQLDAAGLGGMSVRDVLLHHSAAPPVLLAEHGMVVLRMTLEAGHEAVEATAADGSAALPPRPEFFDFDLLHKAQDTGNLGSLPLRQLTYVVFDTETTGLSPSQGDQIVSIAGVRIVNGRILTGESFNRVVHPGRPIPPESTKFHGLTDDMVKDKPPIQMVLPQFRTYCNDAVLVAHNAAFDLKFIRMRERECQLRFDNPILDTMMLSAYVDGTNENQSLDEIAERYGVVVTDRHTALGDSLVTAAVLVRLIDALEAKGIHTLDQAVSTLNITMELHNRASVF